MFTTEYSSVPWVVKSSPWSADSGAVPAAIVIVPPAWALALLPGLLLLLPELLPELDVEELQAASATTAPQSNEAPSGLRYLFNWVLQRIHCRCLTYSRPSPYLTPTYPPCLPGVYPREAGDAIS
jgi:hypothetical protein